MWHLVCELIQLEHASQKRPATVKMLTVCLCQENPECCIVGRMLVEQHSRADHRESNGPRPTGQLQFTSSSNTGRAGLLFTVCTLIS